MKKFKAHLLLLMAISVGIGLFFMEGLFSESKTEIKLPLPQKKSSVSVEEALVKFILSGIMPRPTKQSA